MKNCKKVASRSVLVSQIKKLVENPLGIELLNFLSYVMLCFGSDIQVKLNVFICVCFGSAVRCLVYLSTDSFKEKYSSTIISFTFVLMIIGYWNILMIKPILNFPICSYYLIKALAVISRTKIPINLTLDKSTKYWLCAIANIVSSFDGTFIAHVLVIMIPLLCLLVYK